MSARNFNRLGWAIAYPDADHYYRRLVASLAGLADELSRLAAEHDTKDLAVRNAASILERLANCPAAIQALNGPRRTGPKSRGKLDMAIDALAQCEIEGPGRTDAAYLLVAQAWKVSPGAVQNALTDHREAARRQLDDLISNDIVGPGKFRRQRKGSPPEYWTREELLRAVSLDIRDINGCDGRAPRKKRASKKKTGKARSQI